MSPLPSDRLLILACPARVTGIDGSIGVMRRQLRPRLERDGNANGQGR